MFWPLARSDARPFVQAPSGFLFSLRVQASVLYFFFLTRLVCSSRALAITVSSS